MRRNGLPALELMVWRDPINMILSFDRLRALVESYVTPERVFLFRNRKGDKVKMIGWDGSGPVIAYRRLEERRVNWPEIKKGQKVVQIEGDELALLIHGYNVQNPKHRVGMATQLKQERHVFPAWPRIPQGTDLG